MTNPSDEAAEALIVVATRAFQLAERIRNELRNEQPREAQLFAMAMAPVPTELTRCLDDLREALSQVR